MSISKNYPAFFPEVERSFKIQNVLYNNINNHIYCVLTLRLKEERAPKERGNGRRPRAL
jgi:hypothetical protein